MRPRGDTVRELRAAVRRPLAFLYNFTQQQENGDRHQPAGNIAATARQRKSLRRQGWRPQVFMSSTLWDADPVPSPTVPVARPHLPTADDVLPYLREIDASRWYSNDGPLKQRFQE